MHLRKQSTSLSKNRVSAALLKTEYAAYIYPRKQSTAITEKQST
jgi:hypothetical protein